MAGTKVGKNVELSVEGNILTVKIDLAQNFGRSKGKMVGGKREPGSNDIVATTSGNILVPGVDREIHLGINCYTPPQS